MALAAVPGYLGNDFLHASPGLRFGLLLDIWTTRSDQYRSIEQRSRRRSREAQELAAEIANDGLDAVVDRQIERGRLARLWEKNEDAARDAWNRVLKLTPNDQRILDALFDRQARYAADLSVAASLLQLDAEAVAPFTTGLGSEHPLENGFAFLSPYGLPYLPGSGIKGVLRQAARELASGEWGDPSGWTDEPRYDLDQNRKRIALSPIDALFGKQSSDRDTELLRGALMFWDVFPKLHGNSLQLEVMTPHQTHYYQGQEDPHESGSAIPINFLTVPPSSHFTFHVHCDGAFLASIAPDLAADGHWKQMLGAAFRHAFDWLGFGAKTAVGYGAMRLRSDGSARDASGNTASGTSPRGVPVGETWRAAELKLHPGSGELSVSHGARTARADRKVADPIRAGLPDALRKRLKKMKVLKNCAVQVEPIGNAWRITAILSVGNETLQHS